MSAPAGRTMRMAGLEVRLYPNVVEFWRQGSRLLALTPAEYGEIHRWIGAELEAVAIATMIPPFS